jgi:hypothetical protein
LDFANHSYLCKGLTVTFKKKFVKVSLNAFSLIPLAPFITISANHVSATVGTAITPVTVTNTGAAASYYSIAPAISNGLSFDAKTGTISGAHQCYHPLHSQQQER